MAFFPLMDYSAYKIHANTNTSHQTGSTLATQEFLVGPSHYSSSFCPNTCCDSYYIFVSFIFLFCNHPLSYPQGIYSICNITQSDTQSGIHLISFAYLLKCLIYILCFSNLYPLILMNRPHILLFSTTKHISSCLMLLIGV